MNLALFPTSWEIAQFIFAFEPAKIKVKKKTKLLFKRLVAYWVNTALSGSVENPVMEL